MAKKAGSATSTLVKQKRRRKGVHAKSGTSKIKTSKNYKKISRGQG